MQQDKTILIYPGHNGQNDTNITIKKKLYDQMPFGNTRKSYYYNAIQQNREQSGSPRIEFEEELSQEERELLEKGQFSQEEIKLLEKLFEFSQEEIELLKKLLEKDQFSQKEIKLLEKCGDECSLDSEKIYKDFFEEKHSYAIRVTLLEALNKAGFIEEVDELSKRITKRSLKSKKDLSVRNKAKIILRLSNHQNDKEAAVLLKNKFLCEAVVNLDYQVF